MKRYPNYVEQWDRVKRPDLDEIFIEAWPLRNVNIALFLSVVTGKWRPNATYRLVWTNLNGEDIVEERWQITLRGWKRRVDLEPAPDFEW